MADDRDFIGVFKAETEDHLTRLNNGLVELEKDPATIEPALDLILISRHLERIGDHATNVAEDVIFMVSAKDVRHQ